ncbi:hypothetical protein NLJ89_g1923 [Agrocybe chaxingu]|uniref:F-box domain-containing protein n=1 Tax=Agrocybe chaxingu TaxID=84603 RepID=A0A9W8MZ46_9AGAR|nr:hypothetical protein NLJ89_g1923 [Agrocybe chaxingu]
MDYILSLHRSVFGSSKLSTISLTNSTALVYVGEPPSKEVQGPSRLGELPQEILEAIIDVFSDDQASLRACALVASSWTPRARHHLFGHLDLNLKKWPPPAHYSYSQTKRENRARARGLAVLLQAFTRSPDLPSIVHTLTLDFGAYTHSNDSQDESGPVARELARVISRLTSVRTLSIALPREWRLYSSDLQIACLHLLALPTLDSVSFSEGFFQSKHDLAEVIGQLRAPRTLSLANLRLEDIEDWKHRNEMERMKGISDHWQVPYEPVMAPPVSQLRELYIDCMLDELVEWLSMHDIASISLSKLAVTQGITTSWQPIQTLLDLAGSHLEELEVASESYAWDEPHSSQPRQQSKPTLHPRARPRVNGSLLPNPLAPLAPLTPSSPSTASSLSRLTLDLHAFAVHEGSTIVGPAYWRDWRELDNLLSNSTLFPELREVMITLSVAQGFGMAALEQVSLAQALRKVGTREGMRCEVLPREAERRVATARWDSSEISDSSSTDLFGSIWGSSD